MTLNLFNKSTGDDKDLVKVLCKDNHIKML